MEFYSALKSDVMNRFGMRRSCGQRYHCSHAVYFGRRSYDRVIGLSQNADKQCTQVQLLQD